MTQPHRPSEYHKVTLRTGNAEAAPATRFRDYGPWAVAAYVFCFTEPGQLAQPGDNRFTFGLRGLPGPRMGTPMAVSADVSELTNSKYPHIGDALFLTQGVMLNAPDQFATVLFSMRFWNSPLPVAITMNIGFFVP